MNFRFRRIGRRSPAAMLEKCRRLRQRMLVFEVDTLLAKSRVSSVLEQSLESRKLPQSLTVNNGPELVSKALGEGACSNGLQLRFAQPSKS
jgi:hypothetical protein